MQPDELTQEGRSVLDLDYDVLGIEQMDEHRYRRYLWMAHRDLLREQRKTNGRVTRLERFMLAATGAGAVIMAVVVPLFLANVAK